MSRPLLRIRGVRKQYGSRLVLRSIDLDVAEHQVVCLIGGSGSGKSTLLRCVDLLDVVDDGTVHLGDSELTDPALDPHEARKRIGIVFQAYNLFPHLSVLDNITLAPRQVHGVPRKQAEESARELLARLGLADKAHEHPDRLSGDSSSAPRSPAPWPPSRSCSSSTRSPRPSTPSWWARFWTWWRTSNSAA